MFIFGSGGSGGLAGERGAITCAIRGRLGFKGTETGETSSWSVLRRIGEIGEISTGGTINSRLNGTGSEGNELTAKKFPHDSRILLRKGADSYC